MARIMVQFAESGERMVIDPEAGFASGALHPDEWQAPLADYHLAHTWDEVERRGPYHVIRTK